MEDIEIIYGSENGQKTSECPNLNGKFHGTCYTSGQIRWVCDYVDGIRHGKSEEWFLNGQKSHEIYFLNDLLHGKSEGWFPNGNKSWDIDYFNNKFHGKVKT